MDELLSAEDKGEDSKLLQKRTDQFGNCQDKSKRW